MLGKKMTSIRLIAGSTVFALSACASLAPMPDRDLGITLGLFTKLSEITLRDLKDAEGKLELRCPLTHEYDSAYKKKCHNDAKALVERANIHWGKHIHALTYSDISFDDCGVCLDTFISGREGDDCFDFMCVNVSVKYKDEK